MPVRTYKVVTILRSVVPRNLVTAQHALAALLALAVISTENAFAATGSQAMVHKVIPSATTMQSELPKLSEQIERIARTYEAEVAGRDSKKADEIAARGLVAQEAAVKWTELSVYVATLALLFSAGGLIGLIVSLRLNRQAVRAANSAVLVARESNAAQSRGWVSVNCQLGAPRKSKTHLGVEGIYFEVTATALNHGNSPATSVSFHAEIALLGLKPGSSHDMMMQYADRIRARAGSEAEAIFPSSTTKVGHMVFLPLSDIHDARNGNGRRTITPVIYGCLNYKTPNVDGVRQTRFAYHLVSANESLQAIAIQPDQADWLEKPILLALPGTVVAD